MSFLAKYDNYPVADARRRFWMMDLFEQVLFEIHPDVVAEAMRGNHGHGFEDGKFATESDFHHALVELHAVGAGFPIDKRPRPLGLVEVQKRLTDDVIFRQLFVDLTFGNTPAPVWPWP